MRALDSKTPFRCGLGRKRQELSSLDLRDDPVPIGKLNALRVDPVPVGYIAEVL
jgi:hypothetical protein